MAGRSEVQFKNRFFYSSLFTLIIVGLPVCRTPAQQSPPGSVVDPGVITTRQTITPAGVQAIFSGRVHAVGFCGSNSDVTIAAQEGSAIVYRFHLSSNEGLIKRSLERQAF